jgi:hypothetical protein
MITGLFSAVSSAPDLQYASTIIVNCMLLCVLCADSYFKEVYQKKYSQLLLCFQNDDRLTLLSIK